MTKEPWKAYGESKDVTEKVREKGGIPDPPEDATPGWFARLDGKLQDFINEVVDAATTEAARRFTEAKTPPKDPDRMFTDDIGKSWKYVKGVGPVPVAPPEAPTETSTPDPLGEALADLLKAGKKVVKAFVDEVL
jgi:hypothetical protein